MQMHSTLFIFHEELEKYVNFSVLQAESISLSYEMAEDFQAVEPGKILLFFNASCPK